MSDYIKVLGFQLALELKSDNIYEYLAPNDWYDEEMKLSLEIINELNPDIVI